MSESKLEGIRGREGENQQEIIKGVLSKETSSSSSPPQIFQLNVDCFEHILEWLSFSEQLTFRRTCKHMKQVVDYFIASKYPIFLRLSIFGQRLMEFSRKRPNFFEWTKHLYISSYELTEPQIASIKHILNGLETLKLSRVEIDGDFHEVLLKYCPRLKYLGVGSHTLPETIIGTGNQWLHRRYPTLQHFEIESMVNLNCLFECPDLITFFTQNSNIRIFSTNAAYFWRIGHEMLSSNIRFDRLDIFYQSSFGYDFDAICNLANELCERGVFQRLHLIKCNYLKLQEAQQFSTLCNLEKLHLHSIPNDIPMPAMESIEALSITFGYTASDVLKLIAQNFINLKRMEMQFADLQNIAPFICHAPKVREICVRKLYAGAGGDLKNSDFETLHKERKKLHGACKVTIYVEETVFLKLKWTARLKCSLLELRPIESCEENHLFKWK